MYLSIFFGGEFHGLLKGPYRPQATALDLNRKSKSALGI